MESSARWETPGFEESAGFNHKRTQTIQTWKARHTRKKRKSISEKLDIQEKRKIKF